MRKDSVSNQDIQSQVVELLTKATEKIIRLESSNKELTVKAEEANVLREENELLTKALMEAAPQIDKLVKKSEEIDMINRLDPKRHYRTLGINPVIISSLTPDQLDKLIKGSYRVYASVMHPDVGGDIEQMQKINTSYKFLIDPDNRATYGRS